MEMRKHITLLAVITVLCALGCQKENTVESCSQSPPQSSTFGPGIQLLNAQRISKDCKFLSPLFQITEITSLDYPDSTSLDSFSISAVVLYGSALQEVVEVTDSISVRIVDANENVYNFTNQSQDFELNNYDNDLLYLILNKNYNPKILFNSGRREFGLSVSSGKSRVATGSLYYAIYGHR